MAVPKLMLTEFGIYYILESCVRSLLKAIDLSVLYLQDNTMEFWQLHGGAENSNLLAS